MNKTGKVNNTKNIQIEKNIEKLYEMLKSCHLCPRNCDIDRTKGHTGVCRAGMEITVNSTAPHFGEEPELVGEYGSGTIFLSRCNLRCIYCQNFEISHLANGRNMTIDDMVDAMLFLQQSGCQNINFVTPTHYAPQIAKSIYAAKQKGLKLPIVYNCGGYESLEVIKLLDGLIDIYMPDIKYADEKPAKLYSDAPDYFKVVKEVVKEMQKQVGDLVIVEPRKGSKKARAKEPGIAKRGMIFRHLLLPGSLSGPEKVVRFIKEISDDPYLNIMDQYKPCYRADEFPELNHRPTSINYLKVVMLAKRLGFKRGFTTLTSLPEK
jgi:putative pyruvate formate lyase activating enzyme